MQDIALYIQNPVKYKKKLLKVLCEDIANTVSGDHKIVDSLFGRYAVELKVVLQSNQELFWELWDFFEQLQGTTQSQKYSEYIKTLRCNGILVIRNFFQKAELELLEEDWENSMHKIDYSDSKYQEVALKNRFYFKGEDGYNFAIGSPFDGKKRVTFLGDKVLPKNLHDMLHNNCFLNEIVADYYNLRQSVPPQAIMCEELTMPKIFREDMMWHIDNLSDQFKVMVVLQNMTVDDGPFTYIEGTHTICDRLKDRYHKMYSMNGMTTQEHNHFESSFLDQTRMIKQGILCAGDIVLFDCKIHHSASFVKNNGNRKNIMLYYSHLPTIKNNFLFFIDKFLNFGLR